LGAQKNEPWGTGAARYHAKQTGRQALQGLHASGMRVNAIPH